MWRKKKSKLELTNEQQDDFVELVNEGASREDIAKALSVDPRSISQLIADIVLCNRGSKMREAVINRVVFLHVAQLAFVPKVSRVRKVSKLYRVSADEKAALEKSGAVGEDILQALECEVLCVKLEETVTTQPFEEKLVLKILDSEIGKKLEGRVELTPFSPVAQELLDSVALIQ